MSKKFQAIHFFFLRRSARGPDVLSRVVRRLRCFAFSLNGRFEELAMPADVDVPLRPLELSSLKFIGNEEVKYPHGREAREASESRGEEESVRLSSGKGGAYD
mmetsp:Transcript_7489/g.14974  ORF Transcript_7489/g.14974 Transcript_7489/m.14974 type:complete len:103 (-) Transcript_7489:99-407(-)